MVEQAQHGMAERNKEIVRERERERERERSKRLLKISHIVPLVHDIIYQQFLEKREYLPNKILLNKIKERG